MAFEPEKIARAHIIKAVERIKEENIDLHSSTGYDVIIDGESYPPKEIMRYAHEEMNGEYIWERSGGEPTNEYLGKMGFEIVEKERNKELYKLKEDFLKEWPLERVESMNLEEYTNLNKDGSFCYWLESKTGKIGSIWGGFAYKFGIYKRSNTDSEDSRSGYMSDGEYAWVAKYGNDAETAFETVRELIVSIISASKSGSLKIIDDIDLGDAYKWKIAFLYSNFQIINIFKTDAIRTVGQLKGYQSADSCPISEIHDFLIDSKPDDVDYFDYTHSLWEIYSSLNEKGEKAIRDRKFWMYSPGPNAEYWEEFSSQGIMAIGWDFLGDLKEFGKKKEIKKKLQDAYDTDSSKKNDTTACWEFANVIQPGDVVIAKRGKTEYIGWGIIESEYSFQEERSYYKHTRDVSWKSKGSWPEKDIVTKTLTDITPYQEYVERLIEELQIDKKNVAMNDSSNHNQKELNQILFGPPGTGKTYHTVNKALQIVDPKFYEENKKDRKELTKRYRELLITDWESHKSGQIAMTTFHQSFTYEDFIEGIKPVLIDQNGDDEGSETKSEIGYEIQNGIFKNISELARQESGGKVGKAKNQIQWDREQFNKAEFYKLSLGNINIEEDNEIYKYCINNDRIGIGFLWDEDLTNAEESKINQLHIDNPDYDKHDCTSMAIFRHHLKEGYYVVIANGNHKFRAIGKVVGDYFYDKESPIRYPHFRKVEWIAKDLDLPVDLIYNKNFSQKTIYHLRKKDIKPEFFVRTKEMSFSPSGKKPFVLIIDEINRGNIAQIFGELITLIEEDKREGGNEEISVSLPYSKQPFSVPSNLHIIGTMNTADRSIEALDTALRRRFSFEEMPPDIAVIEKEGALKKGQSLIRVGDSSFMLSAILRTINNRVEKLLDKDHLIGHSYFMDVKTVRDLQRVFYRNIIPLLEEYFYGDKGKIQLVLGKGFIDHAEHSKDKDIFAASEYDDSIFEDREIWKLTTSWRKDEQAFGEALDTLLNKKE